MAKVIFPDTDNQIIGGTKLRIVAWSTVLILAIAVALLFRFPPLPDHIAQAEPWPDTETGLYLHLSGSWFDAAGNALATEPFAVAPLSSGDVLISTATRTLQRCDRLMQQCADWAGQLDVRHEFQAAELASGHIALLSRQPAALYLLDQQGSLLDQQPLSKSTMSLSQKAGTLYLSLASQRAIYSIEVQDKRLGEPQQVMDFAAAPVEQDFNRPERLRRVGEHWWLAMRTRGNSSRLYEFDNNWQPVRQIELQLPGRLFDWAVESPATLVLINHRQQAYRARLDGSEVEALAISSPLSQRLLPYAIPALLGLFLIGIISTGIVLYRESAGYNQARPERTLEHLLGIKRAQLEDIPPPSTSAAEPTWLKPTPTLEKARARKALWHRLSPIGALMCLGAGAALIAALATKDVPWFFLAAIAVISAGWATWLYTQARHADHSAHLELGIDGQDLLLKAPDHSVERFAMGQLLFDGHNLLAGAHLLPLSKTASFEARMEHHANHEPLYQREPFLSHLLPILIHGALNVEPQTMRTEHWRRQNLLWLERSLRYGAALFAISFTLYQVV